MKVFRLGQLLRRRTSRGTFTFANMQQFLAGTAVPVHAVPRRHAASIGRTRSPAFYIQDDWRPRPNLTINARPAIRLRVGEDRSAARGDRRAGSRHRRRYEQRRAAARVLSGRRAAARRTRFMPAPASTTTRSCSTSSATSGSRRRKWSASRSANPSFPDATSGLVSTPPPAIQTIDPDLTTPYNLNSSVGYRRELATNLGIDVSYVHNRGWGQVMTIERNAGIPGTANIFGQDAAGRNPAIASDTYSTNLGFIRYNGLLVDVRKRLSRGVQGGLAYTLSKTEDNGVQFRHADSGPVAARSERRPERQRSPARAEGAPRSAVAVRHPVGRHPRALQRVAAQRHGRARRQRRRHSRGLGERGDLPRRSQCPGFSTTPATASASCRPTDANQLRALVRAGPDRGVRQQPEVSQSQHDAPEVRARVRPPGAGDPRRCSTSSTPRNG